MQSIVERAENFVDAIDIFDNISKDAPQGECFRLVIGFTIKCISNLTISIQQDHGLCKWKEAVLSPLSRASCGLDMSSSIPLKPITGATSTLVLAKRTTIWHSCCDLACQADPESCPQWLNHLLRV